MTTSQSQKRLLEGMLSRSDSSSFPLSSKSSDSVYDLGPVEPVTELIRPAEAWIVRCLYGSEVLVTCGDSALPMIDIDCPPFDDEPLGECSRLLQELELNLQLRVYQTAHGFRLLVENQTIKPNGQLYRLLARAFHCDDSYLWLCIQQECYRARLTPKPGAEPGTTTCRYLGTVGDAGIDEALAPLIQLHDERTGALRDDGELG